MKRIFRMIQLFTLVLAPVVLFIIDNQKVVENNLKKTIHTEGSDSKSRIIYSNYTFR